METQYRKQYLFFALISLFFGKYFIEIIKNEQIQRFLSQNCSPVIHIIREEILNKGPMEVENSRIFELNLKMALGELPFSIAVYYPQLKKYIFVKSKNKIWGPVNFQEMEEQINKNFYLQWMLKILSINDYLGHVELDEIQNNGKIYLLYKTTESFSALYMYYAIAGILFIFIQLLMFTYFGKKELFLRLKNWKEKIENNHEEKQKKLKEEIVLLQETISHKEDYIVKYIKSNSHLGKKVEHSNMFLTNAAFEIKAPLKAIISLIHSFHSFGHTPLQEKYLEVIEQSTIILTQIMNGLLSSSIKINQEEFPLTDSQDLEIFEIDSLMNTIVSLFAPLFHMKKVELYYEIDASVPRIIKGQRNHLMQMIINMIDFCYEFSVTKKVMIIKLKMEEENSNVFLAYTIEASLFYGKELTANILEKDLYLVYRYSKKNNARFSIQEKNKIKVMNLMVPIQQIAKDNSDWYSFLVKRKKVTEKKVLYIDDQHLHANIIKSYLEYFKITYDYFEDLWMAEKNLTQRHEDYSLVIINTDFHQNSAHDFLKVLKQNMKLSEINFWPIIDLDELDRVEDLKKIGIQTFLTRPISRDVFFQSLGHIYYESPISHLLYQKTKKVLLVNDNMDECKIISLYFKNSPIDLKISYGKESAVSMILTENFDLILSAMELQNIFESKENAAIDKIIELRRSQTECVFQDVNIMNRIEKNKNFIVLPIEKNKFLYLIRKRLFQVH